MQRFNQNSDLSALRKIIITETMPFRITAKIHQNIYCKFALHGYRGGNGLFQIVKDMSLKIKSGGCPI